MFEGVLGQAIRKGSRIFLKKIVFSPSGGDKGASNIFLLNKDCDFTSLNMKFCIPNYGIVLIPNREIIHIF